MRTMWSQLINFKQYVLVIVKYDMLVTCYLTEVGK